LFAVSSANFNFRVLAALLHGTLVVSVSQTTALNRGRHLYSAGLPSLWALADISSCTLITILVNFGPRGPPKHQNSQVGIEKFLYVFGRKFFNMYLVHRLAERNEIWHDDRHWPIAGLKRFL